MKFLKTKLQDLYLTQPEPKSDDRGTFARVFCKNELAAESIGEFDMVQINQSVTKRKGTIRGMHFQRSPKEEGKIVQCLRGAIYDVALDLRKDSPTFGEWEAFELTGENRNMLFIPPGFAHGFQALTDNCEVQYFMSEYYSPEYAAGVRYNDPYFNISWPLDSPILSEKDQNHPLFEDVIYFELRN